MDHLPQEIVEVIVKYADPEAVRSFALTARPYVSACRRILFHRVYLFPDKSSPPLHPKPKNQRDQRPLARHTHNHTPVVGRNQRLVDILQRSPEIAQCIRNVRVDAGQNYHFHGRDLSHERFLPMCIRLITSPHRVMFFLKGMDWKDVPKKLSKALTAMIRLPTLRVCSLLMLWNLPISVFNDSQIHTLELLDVSFVCSPSEKRANPTETLKSKRIRLLNLEYRGAPFLPLKQTPFGGSMQPPLFDFSNLQSLGLSTLTHRNPELGTLITECGQSLQSLTISGGFLNVIDLAPLSGLRHLILGFINDEPRFDGTPTLIATVETLNTLKLTDSRLEKVDLFFAENGIALFNAETWDLLDNILFRFFQNSGRVQTIKVRFDAFYPYVSPKDMNLGVVRLPRCREAGLLVDSDA